MRGDTHPLDGARLKVVRAQQHLDAFNSDTDRYHQKEAEFVPGIRRKAEGWEVYAAARKPLPLELSLPVGDCLCCLRSALDYVSWELAKRYCGRPLVEGQDRIYFPVFDTSAGCGKSLKRFANYSIPQDALNIIENVQPYNAGYEPLRWLHLLVNEDKHRLPVLVRSVSQQADFIVRYQGRVIGRGSTTGKAFIPDRSFPPFYCTDDLTVEGQLTTFVSFDDPGVPRQPADDTLANIIKCVSDIIPRFDACF